MTSFQKTVVMIQPSKRQGQIWQASLVSQGISLIWEASDLDLAAMLVRMNQAGFVPPDLLLIDVGVLNSNPYAFCRWCREHYPDQKIVLTNASQKEISPPERQWAIYQGAHDLLPGFQRETLLTGVAASITRILEILEAPPLRQEPLIQVLFSLTTLESSTRQTPPVSPSSRVVPKASTPSQALNRKPVPQELVPPPAQLARPAVPPAPAPTTPLTTAAMPESSLEEEEETATGDRPRRRYRGVTY
ncbi:MAG: response regulator [Leptolyngbyaceae cyanobacterium bins.59]|nr:response regulator [Leptolyngbyaceae cyanobacterium bins.59]